MHFAKHETFHIREGWLTKGLHILQENDRVFLDQEAPEILGMGKNMVRSLRYWMQATGLTEEVRRGVLTVQRPTLLGELIREHDIYLEREATLRLIHYNLACSRDLATTWYYFFNHFASGNFTREYFLERLSHWVNAQTDKSRKVAESSLKKDFATLVKTYLADKSGDRTPEDSMECPLTSLGLLSSFRELNDDDKRVTVYRYETGDAANVHPLVFLYVILRWQAENRDGARQVSLNNILREPMNAGRIFNIGLSDFEALLGRLYDDYGWRITLTRTGGLDQVNLPDIKAEVVLRDLYESVGPKDEELRECWVQAVN